MQFFSQFFLKDSMINKIIIGIIISCVPFIGFTQVLFNNNGTDIYIKQGAKVYVKGNSVKNSGLLENAGLLEIEGDLVNNDTATGGDTTGFYRIQNNWENNGTFIADQSKVELYGADQNITGTSPTTF